VPIIRNFDQKFTAPSHQNPPIGTWQGKASPLQDSPSRHSDTRPVLHIFPRCMHCIHRGLATRKLSLRLSVSLTVCQTRASIVAKWNKVLHRFLYSMKELLSQFCRHDEWLVGATPSTWNFGSTSPRWSEIADFQSIFARMAASVTQSEKSLIRPRLNRKFTTRYPMSLRWI